MHTATDPKTRGWHIIAASLALSIWACSDPSGNTGAASNESGDSGGVDAQAKQAYLVDLADNVLAPTYAEFASTALAFEGAAQAHVEAIDANGDVEASTAELQAAWSTLWKSWQRAELLQIGPSAPSSAGFGGADVRDEIYSWPSVNACRIDQELVLGEFSDADFVSTRLVNVYGIDALEYLVFWQETDNSCAPQLEINSAGEWDALGIEQITARRAQYALSIATALRTQADGLQSTWEQGGQFHEWLSNPGEGDSPYASASEAMDEVMRAIFYTDKVLKDEKIGVPAGLLDCGSVTCISELESSWSESSKEAALENVESFKLIYFGGEDPEASFGMDDLLMSIDRGDLSDAMSDAIESALSSVAAVDGSFRSVLLSDDDALDSAHAGVKEITDLLKGEFAMALMLAIPSEAGGDND